jgi:RNA polymerase sigma-70 factor (ECF subfamily)
VASAAGGSSTEFDEFYAGAAPRLTRQLFLLTGDLGEAEDITHEAFARAWLRWTTVRTYDSPEAWVRTVARRLAVSRWRKIRTQAAAWVHHHDQQRPVPEPAPEHVALVAALRELPEKQRVAVVLHYIGDLTIEQVSAETGSSVSAVKQRLARGRKALAALMSEETPTGATGGGGGR